MVSLSLIKLHSFASLPFSTLSSSMAVSTSFCPPPLTAPSAAAVHDFYLNTAVPFPLTTRTKPQPLLHSNPAPPPLHIVCGHNPRGDGVVVTPEKEHPQPAFGWAARDPSGVLSPLKFSRRETGEKDVTFKVLYCGICHSDIHMIKNEWGISSYPLVPGHEIVGEATEVGSKVEKIKVGDKVGVGYIIGSCNSCHNCNENLENYCPRVITTVGGKYHDGTTCYGGFCDTMVAHENFVVQIPEGIPLDSAAPLLCAGITVYSPLRFYGLDKPGMHLGVVGLGGLGHVAVKFAKAMGLKVTVISTSIKKKQEAIEHLGADSFLVSKDQDQMQNATGSFDGIIDTVSATHPVLPLLGLLKTQGKLVLVGAPEKPFELSAFPLLAGRKMVGGSSVGSLKETQEMIDFAAEHKITADIEVVPMDYVNTAIERLSKGDVRYRFVIDVGKTLSSS